MKILLMQPPWFRLQNASLVHYPVGPAFIAAALEQSGHETLVWNVDFVPGTRFTIGGTNILDTDQLTSNYAQYKKNLHDLSSPIWQEVNEMLARFKPDVVGISVYSTAYQSALNCASIIKAYNPAITTIFGGVHPTIAPEDVAANRDVDFVVIGEGELTIRELINTLAHKGSVQAVKGLAYKENGQVRMTEKRELIGNLDEIGFPARHKLYQADQFPPTAFQALYGSRGCPFHCVFCGSFNVWGHKVRSRSAESLVAEIEYTHRVFKTRYFYLCDDIFFLTRERAMTFCRLLLEKKLPIVWSAQTRAEIIDDELLALMKKSGGQHVAVGIETGDERIRELIKKGNTLAQVRKAALMIKKHGLTLVGFFMFGFPWEGRDEINRTLDFLHEINPTFAFPYIVTPAPGTELATIAQTMGLLDPSLQLEDFYHESPTMCLSAKIPAEERRQVIDHVLKTFALHNRKNFALDLFRRPKFYYYLLHDYGLMKNPLKLFKFFK